MALVPLYILPIHAKIVATYVTGLKTRKIGRPANALAQWCTSWCHQLRACFRNPGVIPRSIMCRLDDAVLWVQAPCKEPLEEAAAQFFWWFPSINFDGRSLGAAQVVNNVFKMAASLAHSTLRWDLKAPGRSK